MAGCAGQSKTTVHSSAPAAASAAVSPEAPRAAERSNAATRQPAATVHVKADDEATEMPAYEVREAAFTDFGMSVRTNLSVKWGERVEWMKVIAIAPGSSADGQGLRPADRILALDGKLITEFDRDSMVDALFQRTSGEVVDVLVLRPKQGLPHFIRLVAGRPPTPAR